MYLAITGKYSIIFSYFIRLFTRQFSIVAITPLSIVLSVVKECWGTKSFPCNPLHNGNMPFPEVLFLSGSLAELWVFFFLNISSHLTTFIVAICFS